MTKFILIKSDKSMHMTIKQKIIFYIFKNLSAQKLGVFMHGLQLGYHFKDIACTCTSIYTEHYIYSTEQKYYHYLVQCSL